MNYKFILLKKKKKIFQSRKRKYQTNKRNLIQTNIIQFMNGRIYLHK